MSADASSGFPKLGFSCPMLWNQMHGSDRERFCGKCRRTVINLSLMTKAERLSLLAQPESHCVTYYETASGEPVGIDTDGLRLSPASRPLKAAAALALASTLPALVGGCATPKQAVQTPPPSAKQIVREYDENGRPIDPVTKKPLHMNTGI